MSPLRIKDIPYDNPSVTPYGHDTSLYTREALGWLQPYDDQ